MADSGKFEDRERLRAAFAFEGVGFTPGPAPRAWAEGDIGWFIDTPTMELAEGRIRVRATVVLHREGSLEGAPRAFLGRDPRCPRSRGGAGLTRRPNDLASSPLRFVLMDVHADRAALEAALAGHGAYELFPCDPALADTAAFCAAYGFGLDESANTIVVVGKSNPPVYAACVVLATYRLDVNHAVKVKLGTRKASFASPDETRELTGHEMGGVTAFGLPEGLPLWVDAAVMARSRIVLGGGSRSWKVIAPASILLTLSNVEVVEGLASPAPPRDPAPD